MNEHTKLLKELIEMLLEKREETEQVLNDARFEETRAQAERDAVNLLRYLHHLTFDVADELEWLLNELQ